MGDRASIIIVDGTKILLMHRIRKEWIKPGGIHESYYCIPGGTVEDGETAQETALRELEEETTLTAQLGEVLAAFQNEGRFETYFLAKSWSGKPQLSGPELEITNADNQFILEWVELAEFKKLRFYPEQLQSKIIEHFQKVIE